MDKRFGVCRRWYAFGMLALMALLAGCASGGGTTPAVSDAAASAATNAADGAVSPQAANAVSQAESQAGPIKRVMQAIGLAKPPPPPPTEQQLQLRIFTAQNLNAGPSDKALAVVVNVYHLRSLDRFKQMPFNDFLDKRTAKAELGDDLVDSREMLLLPDQRYISTEHMSLDTRYIGFVALFRGPAALRWRFAYNVHGSTASGITLGVHGCAMTSTAGELVTVLPDAPDSLASVHCPKPGS